MLLIIQASSIPFKHGILISDMITSGFILLIIPKPVNPLSAVCTRYPISEKYDARDSHVDASLSIISMLFNSFWH